MEDWIKWAIGGSAAALLIGLNWLRQRIVTLEEKAGHIVPREEVDRRFELMRMAYREDLSDIKGTLERIENKLDKKADKR
jgi:hypothetical protein